jgi:hypothetical protein
VKINKFKVVHVTWVDACSCAGWNKIDESDKLSMVESVGILARIDKETIVISSSRSENDNFHGALTIPRINISKMKYL